MTRTKPLTDKVIRGLQVAMISGIADCEGDAIGDIQSREVYDDLMSADLWLSSVIRKRKITKERK